MDDSDASSSLAAWSQSYDFLIYSNNASVVVDRLERFYISEK
jgi:hypothetical protein